MLLFQNYKITLFIKKQILQLLFWRFNTSTTILLEEYVTLDMILNHDRIFYHFWNTVLITIALSQFSKMGRGCIHIQVNKETLSLVTVTEANWTKEEN